nr:MAG TPA: hypothetical protein [Caudoviricetes sp.]
MNRSPTMRPSIKITVYSSSISTENEIERKNVC